MKTDNLLDFHLGALNEEDRLQVEKSLLLDQEVLLNYLDLKRELEGAFPVPQKPSPALWTKLRPTPKNRVWYFGLAAGLAAAGLACFLFYRSTEMTAPAPEVSEAGILFDSNAEHFTTMDVL